MMARHEVVALLIRNRHAGALNTSGQCGWWHTSPWRSAGGKVKGKHPTHNHHQSQDLPQKKFLAAVYATPGVRIDLAFVTTIRPVCVAMFRSGVKTQIESKTEVLCTSRPEIGLGKRKHAQDTTTSPDTKDCGGCHIINQNGSLAQQRSHRGAQV